MQYSAVDIRRAWHDAVCPEGAECRSLVMHRLSLDYMVPVLHQFLEAFHDDADV